jgi:hypothetical protein
MNISITVTQKQLSEVLLNIALVRPVFIWDLQVSASLLWYSICRFFGLPCVSLLGSQLAPEDIRVCPKFVMA